MDILIGILACIGILGLWILFMAFFVSDPDDEYNIYFKNKNSIINNIIISWIISIISIILLLCVIYWIFI